jgi:hypothetical protein
MAHVEQLEQITTALDTHPDYKIVLRMPSDCVEKKPNIREEARWLRDHVFDDYEVTQESEALDARVLFSDRRGKVAQKRVPAMKKVA